MATRSNEYIAAVLREQQIRKARVSFIDFVRFTHTDFVSGWFNREIAEALQQFYKDVTAKKSPRLMIFAAPRHGKSELFSRRFPAWCLGQNPDLSMITASYSQDLASRMSRDVQRIISDNDYRDIFPDTALPSRAQAHKGEAQRTASLFEIAGHRGSYRSAGAGVGITGMGGDILVVDDPVKDAQEANSQTTRNAVFEWYKSTFYTRLSPGGGILVGMTRWHEDDLAGRLLEEMKLDGEQWQILKYSAIAEHDEKHRKEGEALHPERWPIERLQQIKSTLGTYSWASLYQQAPVASGGGLFKEDWWKYYREIPELSRRIIYMDSAVKTGVRNDYSVLQCWGKGFDGNIYLLDQMRGKWESTDLLVNTVVFIAKHREQLPKCPPVSEVKVEDAVSGSGLIQQLNDDATVIALLQARDYSEFNARQLAMKSRIAIKGIQRTTDKGLRAEESAPQIEVGHVFLPSGPTHLTDSSWLVEYKAEFARFTKEGSHAHDDQIDPTLDAIKELLIDSDNTAWAAMVTR